MQELTVPPNKCKFLLFRALRKNMQNTELALVTKYEIKYIYKDGLIVLIN